MRIIENKDQVTDFIKNDLLTFYKNQKLIPFFGAGFTKGELTKRHQVPDAKATKELMIDMICSSKSEILKMDLEGLDFQNISSYFYKFVPKTAINSFLRDYFTNVSLCNEKKDFISLNWPNLYTLNVDDALEINSKFKKILPYHELNKDVLMNRVFKLHGDADHEITYIDDQNIIFSTEQYIKSLLKNASILSCFQEDFLNKNFIFIGCSLQNEIDLEYIVEKTKIKTVTNKVDRIYVTQENPSFLVRSKLEDFGINIILLIPDYSYFYTEISKVFSKLKFNEYNSLDLYKNPTIDIDKDLDFNKKFLISTQTISIKSNKIKLPIYFSERTVLHDIISNYIYNHINIIIGRRISGKTFLAIDIAKRIINRDVYLFLSNISISTTDIAKLLNLTNVLLIFDTGSIGYDEIKLIADSKQLLERNNNHIIIFFNSSDRLLLSIPSTLTDCETFQINNRFDSDETELINDRLSSIGLIKINSNKTILDNIFISKERYINSLEYELHQISESLTEKDIKILILSASFDKVYSSVFRHLNINTEDLETTIKKIGQGSLIEFDYTADIEDFQHSSFKIIVNSKAYLFRLLGHYVENGNRNVKRVADYMFDMVYLLTKDARFNSFYRSLVLFDNLNQIFLKKEGGVINLIFLIYEKLESILYQGNQYWIQRAKSILYLKQKDEVWLNKAIVFAQKAYHDSSDYSNLQLQSSFLISMLYGRLAHLTRFEKSHYVHESISWYYTALQESSYNKKYVDDFLQRAKREKSDNDFYALCTFLVGKKIPTENGNNRKISFLVNTLMKWN